jgi:predicted transcriptional regulator
MSVKKRSTPLVQPKDLQVLHFIWWWKIASTAAVAGRFSSEYRWHPTTVHGRLLKLKKKGLVAFAHADQHHGIVWTLTAKGFRIVEQDLPKLKERGFASEHVRHDLLVQAMHLGNWLPRDSAPDVEFFSEQELRRIDPGCYPEWVPHGPLHRPDGYWSLPGDNGRRVIALEIEITLKNQEDYGSAATFYNHTSSITSTLWLVNAHAVTKRVLHATKHSVLPFRNIHEFVMLSDFEKNGWNAKIYTGVHAGQSISEFLDKEHSREDQGISEGKPKGSWTQAILDTRLYSVDSLPYVPRTKDANS